MIVDGAYRRPAGAGERAFLERLRARLPAAPDGQVWVGDDAAVLEGGLLFATDALVAGVHFDPAWAGPEDVGWKALAVNLSDLAAMGGAPVAAVAAVVVPSQPPGSADGVLAGMAEASERFACPLVGGDTTSGAELVVAVAVLGRAAPQGAVLRSGARPGDTVFVTGALGGAKRALDTGEGRDRLRRPVPRLEEGRAAVSAAATAMIDVSDGLAVDLARVCEASGVGVLLDEAAVPLAPGASLADALGGGDDYELCFTAANVGAVVEAFAAAELGPPAAVGRITAPGGGRALPDVGWEHPVP